MMGHTQKVSANSNTVMSTCCISTVRACKSGVGFPQNCKRSRTSSWAPCNLLGKEKKELTKNNGEEREKVNEILKDLTAVIVGKPHPPSPHVPLPEVLQAL
jgi:hypothetical protein